MPSRHSLQAKHYGNGADYTSNPESLPNESLSVAENMRFTRQGGAYTRLGYSPKADIASSAKIQSLASGENAMYARSGTKVYYSTNDGATWSDTGATRTAGKRDFMLARGEKLFATNDTDDLLVVASDYSTSTVSGINGTCLAELENSLLIGDGNIIRYSAPATEANPEFFYDFAGNGAGSKNMDSSVNCLHAAAGIVIIGLENSIEYAYGFDLDTGILQTRNLTKSHGVPNAWCIVYIENSTFAIFTGRRILLCLADANGVRIIDDPFRPKSAFDYPVRGILEELDSDQSLSFGHFDPARRELFISVIQDGLSKELVCNIDIGAWSVDIGKTFSCKTNWKGLVYAGDESDDKIHLCDDGTTDNGLTIRHRIVTKMYEFDSTTVDALVFKYDAAINATGEFYQRMFVNGNQALEELVTSDDLQNDGLISLESGIPLGSGEIGTESFSGGSVAEVYRFTYPWEFLNAGERFQFEFEVYDEGSAFELKKSTLSVESADELLVPAQ